jgi:hypothetical protein
VFPYSALYPIAPAAALLWLVWTWLAAARCLRRVAHERAATRGALLAFGSDAPAAAETLSPGSLLRLVGTAGPLLERAALAGKCAAGVEHWLLAHTALAGAALVFATAAAGALFDHAGAYHPQQAPYVHVTFAGEQAVIPRPAPPRAVPAAACDVRLARRVSGALRDAPGPDGVALPCACLATRLWPSGWHSPAPCRPRFSRSGLSPPAGPRRRASTRGAGAPRARSRRRWGGRTSRSPTR